MMQIQMVRASSLLVGATNDAWTAENNPAYDYPDEEMSWDDEDDDPTAIYSKYRDRAASDDEEFGIFDSASEGENRHEY